MPIQVEEQPRAVLPLSTGKERRWRRPPTQPGMSVLALPPPSSPNDRRSSRRRGRWQRCCQCAHQRFRPGHRCLRRARRNDRPWKRRSGRRHRCLRRAHRQDRPCEQRSRPCERAWPRELHSTQSMPPRAQRVRRRRARRVQRRSTRASRRAGIELPPYGSRDWRRVRESARFADVRAACRAAKRRNRARVVRSPRDVGRYGLRGENLEVSEAPRVRIFFERDTRFELATLSLGS